MSNLSRRGFFGQITAFIAGCTFFPFFKKDTDKTLPFISDSEFEKIKFKESNNEWGEIVQIPIIYYDPEGKKYNKQIVNARHFGNGNYSIGFQIILS